MTTDTTNMTRDDELLNYLQEAIPDEDPAVRDALCVAIVKNQDLFIELRDRSQQTLEWSLAELRFRTRNLTNADIDKVEPIRLAIQEELKTRLAAINDEIIAEARLRTGV